jgi:hypothetical protein
MSYHRNRTKMTALETTNKNDSRGGRMGRLATWIAMPAFIISMLGIGAGGYCDYKARSSPTAPDTVLGYTEKMDWKDTTLYVSHSDAEICTAYFPINFVAMGIFLVTGFWYRFAFGRFTAGNDHGDFG